MTKHCDHNISNINTILRCQSTNMAQVKHHLQVEHHHHHRHYIIRQHCRRSICYLMIFWLNQQARLPSSPSQDVNQQQLPYVEVSISVCEESVLVVTPAPICQNRSQDQIRSIFYMLITQTQKIRII